MRKILAGALTILGLATLAGCATAPTAPVELPDDAYGTWQSPVEGAFLEIRDDGTFGGDDGCNGIGGEYTVGDGALELQHGFSTQMFCEGVDDWLKRAATVEVAGDTLIAYDDAGAELGQLTRE